MCVVTLSLIEPNSFLYHMVHDGGWLAYFCVIAIGIMSVVLMADTAINDMLPTKYTLEWAIGCRQHMWMTTGLLYSAFAFQLLTSRLSYSWATMLTMYALGCFTLAFIDAATQKMDPRRCAQA